MLRKINEIIFDIAIAISMICAIIGLVAGTYWFINWLFLT